MAATDRHRNALDDADGRRRRGRILLGLSAVALVVSVAGGILDGRRAESRMRELRIDVAASFGDLTRADLLAIVTDNLGSVGPSALEFLTTDGGAVPDLVEVGGTGEVRARYPVGSRCLRVVWTDRRPQYDEGEGRQCSTISLE